MSYGLVPIDAVLFRQINDCHHGFVDTLFFAVTQLGSGWVVIPLLAALLAVRFRRKILVPALVCAAALAIGGTFNNIVKNVVDRPRPLAYFAQEGAIRPGPVHVVGEPLRAHSFPSGHTNTAFSAATLIVIYLGKRWWPAFVAAALVGYSRVYLGAHFPSDVAAGAVLGVCMSGAIALAAMRLRPSAAPVVARRSDQTAPADGSPNSESPTRGT